MHPVAAQDFFLLTLQPCIMMNFFLSKPVQCAYTVIKRVVSRVCIVSTYHKVMSRSTSDLCSLSNLNSRIDDESFLVHFLFFCKCFLFVFRFSHFILVTVSYISLFKLAVCLPEERSFYEPRFVLLLLSPGSF